jgi:hypothetical protein
MSLTHEPGYYMMDWYDGDLPGPETIHPWMLRTPCASDYGLKTAR